MRDLSSALETAQNSVGRTPLYRATIRDLHLSFDTTYTPTLPKPSHTVYTWNDAILGASCKDSAGAVHQAMAMNDAGYDRIYYRKVSDLSVWTGSWSGLGYFAEGRCRCGIAESGGIVRIFYWGDGSNQIYHLQKNGSWGTPVSLGWAGGTMSGVGLAAVGLNTVYAYVALSGVSGHRLYRCHYTTSWVWETGPHIFTGKGQGNLYPETFISAVTLNGVDYIVLLDHDDGRAVLVKYDNGLFSNPLSVLPIDIVSDPSDVTMPSSQLKPYDLSVVNSQLFLTGRLIRPGSDTYDFDVEVLLRGDGEHWALDKYHCLWPYANSNYVGMKSYVVNDYCYLVAPQKVARSQGSMLVGVDWLSKKTVITSDIKEGNLGYAVNSAASLDLQIAKTEGIVDSQQSVNMWQPLSSGFYTRAAQRKSVSRTVNGLSFVLLRGEGSPSGSVTFSIRKVSDDSVIASVVWGDASAVPAQAAWCDKTFSSPVAVNEEVRLCVEYSGTDRVYVGYWLYDVKPGEYLTCFSGSWESLESSDLAYKLLADYEDDPNIRPGSELTLELGWNDNQGNSGYVTYLLFGIDSVETLEAYGEDRLSISARSAGMKSLLDWRASQAYDYFSQCKLFEPFDDLGGFTEWATGWNISGGILQCTKLYGKKDFPQRCPKVVLDTTDWTTLDGVLVKTRFRFVGDGERAAAILFNATDADYLSVIQASTASNDVRLYNKRDGVWQSFIAQSGSVTWNKDTWYDLAVLYWAGRIRAFYKLASATAWTECGSGFPYTWALSYPAIEAEIHSTDSKETQAKGDIGETYSADEGYVGLRAFAGVDTTVLNQELFEPDMGEDEPEETVLVKALGDFPSSGVIQIGDEIIIYTSKNTTQTTTTLTDLQEAEYGEEKAFEVVNPAGFPGHGVIYVGTEAIIYSGYENHTNHKEFEVQERAAGDTLIAEHAAGATVYLDNGTYVRDCTHFFKVPHVRGVPDSLSTPEYLNDPDRPWSGFNPAHCRLEVTYPPGTQEDSGAITAGFSGKCSAGAGEWNRLKAEGEQWIPNEWDDRLDGIVKWVHLTAGLGAGQAREIISNDADNLYVTPDFSVKPDSSTYYVIWPYERRKYVYNSAKSWADNEHNGRTITILTGDGAPQQATIADTVAESSGGQACLLILQQPLTFANWDVNYLITSGSPGATQIREVSSTDGDKLYPTEIFDETPRVSSIYTIRGRGAYGTSPSAHAEGATVYEYVANPVEFEHAEVYSLGRDHSLEYLLAEVCYRAGVEAAFDTKVSATSYANVPANSYSGAGIDLPICKNFEIILSITAPDDDYAAWGLVFRSATNGPWSGTLPITGEDAYEIKIRDNAGSPYIQLSNNEGGEAVLERAAIGFDVAGTHVWRVSAWEDFFSVWCDDRFVWAFHDTAKQDKGYMAVRAYNYDSAGGSISYSLEFYVPGLGERFPWFGYISGMTGQQAIQDLIGQRHVWYLERPDKRVLFSRFSTRDNLGTYSDLHELSKSRDDRSVASVVLVTSEKYAFFVHPSTLAEYGYRFLEVNNPDLETEEECYEEAKVIQRMTREFLEHRGYFTERARLEAEPEDRVTIGGSEYVVDDVSLTLGLARLSQNVGARKHASG